MRRSPITALHFGEGSGVLGGMSTNLLPFVVQMTTMTAEGTREGQASEWRMKARLGGAVSAHGKATEENLKAYVARFEASTRKDGVNAHLGVTVVAKAKIVDQRSGKVLVTYQGPSFVTFDA